MPITAADARKVLNSYLPDISQEIVTIDARILAAAGDKQDSVLISTQGFVAAGTLAAVTSHYQDSGFEVVHLSPADDRYPPHLRISW